MRIIFTRSISVLFITLVASELLAHLNFWCNIIKAIKLPFALLPILHFTSSKRILGPFRNNIFFKLICYLITICVLSINIYFLIEMIVSTYYFVFGIFAPL